MLRKEINEFTEDEKNWMNTLAANYSVAQSDGFQLGYAQAVSDFTEYITDYWNGSDDKPQISVLDALVDLGEQIRKRKQIVEDNIRLLKDAGYEQHYLWKFKLKDEAFPITIKLFTKEFASDNVAHAEEQESDTPEREDVQIEPKSVHPDKESVQIEQESDQIEPEDVHVERESAQIEQGDVQIDGGQKEADDKPDPEQPAPEDASLGKAYGKWTEYMGKALSTLEQNLIIKGMTEENYTLSQIQSVVRLSQQTICNRKKKMKEAGELS